MVTLNDALITLVTSGGVVGVIKLVDGWISKRSKRKEAAKKEVRRLEQSEAETLRKAAEDFRRALAERNHQLEHRMSELQREVDAWRDKYYVLGEQQASLQMKVRELHTDNDELSTKIFELTRSNMLLKEDLHARMAALEGAKPHEA